MAFCGAVLLVWKIRLMAHVMKSAALIGAIMTFIALFTGAVWGKPTWNTWWVWDARVTSMLILFFLYLESKATMQTGRKAAAILALVGTVNIPIIYKSVDWWFSLHQPATIKITEASSMAPSMLRPLLLAILAFYVLYLSLLMWRTRVELLEEEKDKSWLSKMVFQGEKIKG
ncbi:UNVERIFIED_CONTAM: hypothetical protein GTU68_057921 [Idotea baltica]|nr:hypothetical protein [Idotea baltica]